MRRAATAVLRLSDLISTFRTEPGGWGEPRIPTCSDYPGDRSNTTITGKAVSSFTDGFDVMGSKALFFKSKLDAVNYWKKTAGSAFAACNAWAITQNVKPGATATPVEARALPAPATGADATAAYRTVTRFDVPDHPSYDWYETTVFVRAGRALGMVHVAYANQVCECYAGMARVLTQRLRAASR
jgi:hypothetical protein